MNYSELLSSYIKQSKMSLSEISDKLKEKGFSTDKGYLSKLQNGKIPPASEKLNTALADILDGDATMLELLAFIDKSPDIVKALLSNFDEDMLNLLAELIKKNPNSSIDLIGDNDLNIEHSEDLIKIKEHTDEVLGKLLENGKSDYFNEQTLLKLKEEYDGLFDFEKKEHKIRERLKTRGLKSTINLINALISNQVIYDEYLQPNNVIQDDELLKWYRSLPDFGEKTLRKLRAIWDMMQDDDE